LDICGIGIIGSICSIGSIGSIVTKMRAQHLFGRSFSPSFSLDGRS